MRSAGVSASCFFRPVILNQQTTLNTSLGQTRKSLIDKLLKEQARNNTKVLTGASAVQAQ